MKKISVKLVITISVSIFVSFIITMISSELFILVILKNKKENLPPDLASFKFLINLFLFLIIFVFLINKKVKYIKYIANNIKTIPKGNLELKLDVKGKDEISELCESINEMTCELKLKSDREKNFKNFKNELITSISHDLRAPLTSIIGYIDLIKYEKYNDEKQFKQYMNIIVLKSRELASQIDDLFDTKLSEPEYKLKLCKINLRDILEQIIGEYIPVFLKENLEIKKKMPKQNCFIKGDVNKIVRIFENLFTNSLKYSLKNDQVFISLEYIKSKAIISISNTINNFDKKNLVMLFEKYYTINDFNKDKKSTGLGLAITKRIVEMHNGKIYIKYKNERITFCIEFEIID
jgi:signal transduction histidine kinase